jgi:hypothetical protein
VIKNERIEALDRLEKQNGPYMRAALGEVIRIGYEYFQNEDPAEYEQEKERLRNEQKPGDLMTADFQIFIMDLEREIVKTAEPNDLIEYLYYFYYLLEHI